MLLSELEIAERMVSSDEAKRLVITPIVSAKNQFGPSSLDVRLGTEFALLENINTSHLDTLADKGNLQRCIEAYTRRVRIGPNQPFYLHPGEFVLASTLEFIKVPSDLAGRIEGRSSWGRVGLLVHATAGFVDPGFCGVLTFELLNAGKLPIALKPGLRIGQICFIRMSEASRIPYESKKLTKYSGATGVQPSKVVDDPEIGPVQIDA